MKFFTTAWHNIRRSPYQAMAAVLIMTLTFLVVSFFTFLIVGSSRVITFFESKPQVTAFFKDEAKQEDINRLENELNLTGKIASMEFVSKEEALVIYKEQNKSDPLLLDLVTADILPASLEISTKDIGDMGEISDMLKRSEVVQEVVFQKDVVSTLVNWTTAARRIGIGLIAVLSLVSVFIIITIIGIKISQKREDIEIMRLIGASGWYVRWPFLLEGMFYGVVGAAVAWIVASGALLYATPFLSTFLQGIPIFPVPIEFYLMLLGLQFLLAIVLGFFASFLAVLRYLK
ncbi:MAG: permease-like cell division protein FtsX [Candidatus Levyibacteriota bacterium]